jgi:O-antigen/teichoic acid export membrane protein
LKSAIASRLPYLRTAAWSSAEYLFYPFLLLLSTPVFLRFLGPAEFGLWMLVVAVYALSGATNLGMSAATIKFVSEGRGAGNQRRVEDTVRQTLGFALGAGFVVFMLLAVLAPLITSRFLGQMGDPARVSLALQLGGAILLVQQAELVFTATLKGAERFDIAAKIEMFTRFGLLCVTLLAAWLSSDALVVIGVTLGTMCASCALRGIFASRVVGSRIWVPRLSVAGARSLGRFAGWSWVQSMASAMFQVCDRLIVGAMLGASALAAYTVCTQLGQQIHALPAAAMSFLFPLISRRLGAGNTQGARSIRRAAVAVNLAIALALGTILIGGSTLILGVWMGTPFAEENTTLFIWIVIAYAILSANVAPHFLLMGHGDVRFLSILGLAGGVASIVAMVLLIPAFGLLGAAWGRALYGLFLTLSYLRLPGVERRTASR